jgi:hypothetical protein
MTVNHPETDVECWARDYWLGHCEGFRVDDENGRLGVVDQILGDDDEPEELVVRGGLFVSRRFWVPVDAIREIEPRARRIRVRMDGEPVR